MARCHGSGLDQYAVPAERRDDDGVVSAMANIFAPFGFSHVSAITGQSPNFGQTQRLIAANNGNQFFFGDPVIELTSGYIDVAPSSGAGTILGIFIGCFYASVSDGGVTKYPRTWLGSDAIGDVNAYVLTHPESIFHVQSGAGGPLTLSSIGSNINFLRGTGNTSTGQSGAYVDPSSLATTATLPFLITGLVQSPPGGPGTDATTAFNWVSVAFNNQTYKTLTGV